MRTWAGAVLTAATLFGTVAAFGQTPTNPESAKKYAPCAGQFEGDFSLSQRLYVCNEAIDSKTFQGKDLASFYVHRWAVLNAKDELAAAQQDLEKALAIWPGIADDVAGFAKSDIDEKKYDLATAALDTAEKAQPGNRFVHYYFADLHLRQGALDLAARENAEALAIQPGDEDALRQQSNIRAIQGDTDGAVAVLDALIAKHPGGDVVLYNSRCYLRGVAGRDLDKALADCNAALRIKPNDSAVLDSRGLVYLRMDRFAEAIADYTAAITLADHPSPTSFYGRALAEQYTGNGMSASADFAAAQALSPGIDKKFNTVAMLAE